MKTWDTVAIVGVGLIGGSIGLALQQRGLARQVVGIGRRASSLRKARRHGTVTRTTMRLDRGVSEAELVIICTPVQDIVRRVCEAARFCPASALITDVGSTKALIASEVGRCLSNSASFVGSHPMAGSERTGSENARPDLFQDRVTVITPTRHSRSGDVAALQRFWRSLGSHVRQMSPEAHDRMVAITSHAAHVVAAALAAATSEDALPLVATGWKDTTRIAAGDAELWRQILMMNRTNVLRAMDSVEKVLGKFRSALEAEDDARIVKLLNAGKHIRDSVGS